VRIIIVAQIVANGMSLTVMFVMTAVLILPVMSTKLMIKNRGVKPRQKAPTANKDRRHNDTQATNKEVL
jgi:hypothetical protein